MEFTQVTKSAFFYVGTYLVANVDNIIENRARKKEQRQIWNKITVSFIVKKPRFNMYRILRGKNNTYH